MKRPTPEDEAPAVADPTVPATTAFPPETPLRVYCLRCGKSYASNDGVRKHSKRYHPQWMAQMDARREPVSGPTPPLLSEEHLPPPSKRGRYPREGPGGARAALGEPAIAQGLIANAMDPTAGDRAANGGDRPAVPGMVDPTQTQGFWMRVLPPVKRGGQGGDLPTQAQAVAAAAAAASGMRFPGAPFAPMMPFPGMPPMPLMPGINYPGMGMRNPGGMVVGQQIAQGNRQNPNAAAAAAAAALASVSAAATSSPPMAGGQGPTGSCAGALMPPAAPGSSAPGTTTTTTTAPQLPSGGPVPEITATDSLVNALTLTPSEVNLFTSVLDGPEGSAGGGKAPPSLGLGHSITGGNAKPAPPGNASGLNDQIVDSFLELRPPKSKSRDLGGSESLAVA